MEEKDYRGCLPVIVGLVMFWTLVILGIKELVK